MENTGNDKSGAEVRDNESEQGNDTSSMKKNLKLVLIGSILILVVVVGVLIGRSDSEEEDDEILLDDSFCSEFGVTDDIARTLIRRHARLSETFISNNESIVTLEVNRKEDSELRQLTCIPSEAFDDSLFDSTDIQGIALKNCPVTSIHPDAFVFSKSEVITLLEIFNLPFKELPENVFLPLTGLNNIDLRESKLETLPQNIVGDLQISGITLIDNKHLVELPTFLKQQNELQFVTIIDTDILVVEEENFGSLSNLELIFIREAPNDLAILEPSEVAENLGVPDEVVDVSSFTRGVCLAESLGINSDFDARDEFLRNVNINADTQDVSFVFVNEGESLILFCLPPNTFAALSPEDRELFLSFTDASLSFESDFLTLHPDTFKEDIYDGFTSLTFSEISFTDDLVDGIFEKFVNLQHFELLGVAGVDPVEAKIFGDNCNLKSIKVDIFLLRQVPIFVSDCIDIEIIDVSGCPNLRFLDPKTFENLNSLKTVNLRDTEVARTRTKEEIAEIIGVNVDVIEV